MYLLKNSVQRDDIARIWWEKNNEQKKIIGDYG